ncbi:DUF3108 domain-containing protein [Paucibacter sp. JuS9]|uniref:DUF3108 domain-containing protein n=1 Tax=Paucibacter sp. JuS9 TaxID=3228748 RepID=UPI003757E61E
MAFAALLVLVLCGHWRLVDELQAQHQRWAEMAAMPPRMQAAFVRELLSTAPPATRARPAHAPTAATAATATAHAGPAAPAASAAQPAVAVAPPDEGVAEPLPPKSGPLEPPEPTASAPQVASAAASAPATAASSAAPAASDEPGPEWPLSTRLTYTLLGYYNGEVHGDAQVEWIRQGRRYQVNLDVGIGPRLTPFLTRRMSSEGELGGRGISPRRFDEETKIIFRERRLVTMLFQRGQVQLANGRSEPSPAEVQDASSQFVQLTWLFLTGRELARPGLQVLVPLALPRRLYADWRYQVVGEETIETPMGPLATWHLRPTLPVAAGDFSVEMWLAPSLQWLPVRLKIRQDEQIWIDMLLKSPPLQAAPEPIVQTIKKESKP